MKIIYTDYNSSGEIAVFAGGDDGLLKPADAFYIPDFAASLGCVPQFVYKSEKLGKYIGARFASRYYATYALALRFYAESLAEELKGKGLPYAAASSFEGCLALSDFEPLYSGGSYPELRLSLNKEEAYELHPGDIPMNPDEVLAHASVYYMIKMGDIFCSGNRFRLSGLKRGDIIRLTSSCRDTGLELVLK